MLHCRILVSTLHEKKKTKKKQFIYASDIQDYFKYIVKKNIKQ